MSGGEDEIHSPHLEKSTNHGSYIKTNSSSSSIRRSHIHDNKSHQTGNAKSSFKTTLISFKDYCNSKQDKIISIAKICKKFEFQRRRFYDVINVLETVGVAHKINSENFHWCGLNQVSVRNTIFEICNNNEFNVFDKNTTLYQIFSTNEDNFESKLYSAENAIVGISNITKYFLVTFIALNTKTLDVKELSYILSKGNKSRQKTMLCKLYLVGNILESVGILYKKGKVTSEFSFSKEYYIDITKIISTKPEKKDFTNQTLKFCEFRPEDSQQEPHSIQSLLSHPPKFQKPKYILARREAYMQMHNIWFQSSESTD